jgi:ribonuclease J
MVDSAEHAAARGDSTEPLGIVALGGLGEIGMNCLALEQRGEVVLVDCGVTFPTTDLGVDVLYPRFDYVLERRDRVRGIVLTHGHEDHIGGLPYLLSDLDVPVFGPPHAIELARRRLAEHGFEEGEVDLRPVHVGATFEMGSFGFESIRVTHSIADATALAIRTDAGIVVHTGDFKLDPTPSDGEITDEARFAELGREGVRLLMSDSTGIDAAGASASERDVGIALDALVSRAKGRVVVGMFASNIQRLILLGDIAQRAGRRICLLGRSVQNHVRVAQALGRLRWPSDLVVAPDVAASMPRERVLIVASGTQAERAAALTRLALGTHSVLRLDEGDVVILSSRIIPGNDRPVFEMMAGFLRAGVELVSRITNAGVHTSGHAQRDEQLRMIQLTEPRGFVPLHGTLHHLMRHADLARDAGVRDVFVAENGDLVRVGASAAIEKTGRTIVGKVATFGGEDLGDDVLAERAQLGRAGIAFVALVVDARGLPVATPQVIARGVLSEGDGVPLQRAVIAVTRALQEARGPRGAPTDEASIVEIARSAVRRSIEQDTGHRPLVNVAVTRV